MLRMHSFVIVFIFGYKKTQYFNPYMDLTLRLLLYIYFFILILRVQVLNYPKNSPLASMKKEP